MNTLNSEIKEWEINTSEYDGFGMDLLAPKTTDRPQDKKYFQQKSDM